MKQQLSRARRRTAAIVLTSALALSMGACGSSSSSPDGDGELVIGGLLAMTGAQSAAGKGEINGINARILEVNEAGGIEGHKVKLAVGDDQLDPAKAPGVARQLVESDKSLAIIGAGSADSYAVLPYLAQKKVLAIPGSGSGTLLSEKNTTYRLTVPGYDKLAAFVVDYAVNTLGKKKIAIAYTPDAVGEPLKEGAEKMLKSLGLEPAAVVSYNATTTNAGAQAAQLKASGADFVVINYVASIATVVIKANEQIGYKPDYGSTFALANTALPDIMGNTLDGRIYFATHHPLPDSPDASQFVKSCGKVEGCDAADGNVMTGYMAADATIKVLEAAVKANDGRLPTAEQVLKATNGLALDTPLVKGIKWTDTAFTGSDRAQIQGLKDRTYVKVTPFAALPDLS